MPVSARADYALRAAIELAAAPGSHVTIKELARAQIVTDRFLETIMTHLRRGNIVRKRGSDGGFWLARPATEISVADIIRAIDGQLPSVRGEPPDNVTYPGAAEPLRRVWVALHAFGPAVLETVTLADIVSGELWLPGRAPSGFVTAVGAGVDPSWTGQRVWAFAGLGGGYAEQAVASAAELIPLPPDMPAADAVTVGSSGAVAHFGLRHARFAPGESVLVRGAAGGHRDHDSPACRP